MGGSIVGITTDWSVADPYAWKNTLALPLIGIGNDVSNRVNIKSSLKTASQH